MHFLSRMFAPKVSLPFFPYWMVHSCNDVPTNMWDITSGCNIGGIRNPEGWLEPKLSVNVLTPLSATHQFVFYRTYINHQEWLAARPMAGLHSCVVKVDWSRYKDPIWNDRWCSIVRPGLSIPNDNEHENNYLVSVIDAPKVLAADASVPVVRDIAVRLSFPYYDPEDGLIAYLTSPELGTRIISFNGTTGARIEKLLFDDIEGELDLGYYFPIAQWFYSDRALGVTCE